MRKYFFNPRKKSPGQALLEILIASAVVAIIFGGVAALFIVGLRVSKQSRETSQAQTLIQDMSAAVRGLSSQDWHSIWGSSGLVSYFGLDEGSDSRVYEPVNGSNGTVVIGPAGNSSLANAWQASASCRAGQCLSFDGVDDYVDAGNNSVLNFTSSDFTISVWIRATSTTGTIIERGLSQTDGYTFMFDPYVHLLTHQAGVYTYCRSQNPIGVGTWTHWVAVRQGSNIRLYRNGVEDVPYTGGTCTAISNPLTSTRPLTIGKGSTWGYTNGLIDEVRIYNRALSATEVSNLYNGIAKLYPQNIGGLWQIKEGEETVTSGGVPFTRSFSVHAVRRDANGNIVSSGGSDDPSTRRVVYSAGWRGRSVISSEYISRAQTRIFIQTDWSGGSGEEGPISITTTKFSTSSNLITTSTGEMRLKLTTE